METKCATTTRETGGKVEITTTDGNIYRISFIDNENMIRVQTTEGTLIILPAVSNEIRIQTKQD